MIKSVVEEWSKVLDEIEEAHYYDAPSFVFEDLGEKLEKLENHPEVIEHKKETDEMLRLYEKGHYDHIFNK